MITSGKEIEFPMLQVKGAVDWTAVKPWNSVKNNTDTRTSVAHVEDVSQNSKYKTRFTNITTHNKLSLCITPSSDKVGCLVLLGFHAHQYWCLSEFLITFRDNCINS